MRFAIPLSNVTEAHRPFVGGKAHALAMMSRVGMTVPDCLCITTGAYAAYIGATGIDGRIGLELNRKKFEDMRWEEIWDASLRIRNIFLRTPLPRDLEEDLAASLAAVFPHEQPVVVRSSAPGEDSAQMSFAGLHESYVNVRGVAAILDHIRLVWASLWSDRALLYRKELGLDIRQSTMAVVVQELAAGERSGIIFTMSPEQAGQAVVEAVHGLNQGLVDGTIEPDRWLIDRESGKIVSHRVAVREQWIVPSPSGVSSEPLPGDRARRPPLVTAEVRKVFTMGKRAERAFGAPQDMEWCFRGNLLFTLQSRPITRGASSDGGDERPWYLTLHRSFENLKVLWRKVEDEVIPGMERDGAALKAVDPGKYDDPDLAGEIERRQNILREWNDAYTQYCIPFAHGMRLFGQIYNDTVKPSDPFEFMDLLGTDRLAGLDRNRMLQDLASLVEADDLLRRNLDQGIINEAGDASFWQGVDEVIGRFGLGTATSAEGNRDEQRQKIGTLVIEMARGQGRQREKKADGQAVSRDDEHFLGFFSGDERSFAENLLELGRASYRLRDDDNIALGKVEAAVARALEEGRRRLDGRGFPETDGLDGDEIVKALRDPVYRPALREGMPTKPGQRDGRIRARQIVGQPASPGIATGTARVIVDPGLLFDFKAGEILVCDAIDPNMTFIVPLAAAIVERRGGMLIHGAIIAREYGIPCVTGIPGATEMIRTGDHVTVDGYLGIVIIGRRGTGVRS